MLLILYLKLFSPKPTSTKREMNNTIFLSSSSTKCMGIKAMANLNSIVQHSKNRPLNTKQPQRGVSLSPQHFFVSTMSTSHHE